MAPIRFLIFIFILINIGFSLGYETARGRNYPTHEELPCLTIGGLCVLSTECPNDKRANKGLCPVQQKNGIECCHALPTSENRCQKHGGECVQKQQKCPPNLTFSRATDCSAHEKCCVLVN